MNALKQQPLTYRIISGTRTYEQQNQLFKKRPKVTNARGGQSNHNFGIAWDVGLFEEGKYYEGTSKKEDKAYVALGVRRRCRGSNGEAIGPALLISRTTNWRPASP